MNESLRNYQKRAPPLIKENRKGALLGLDRERKKNKVNGPSKGKTYNWGRDVRTLREEGNYGGEGNAQIELQGSKEGIWRG